MNVDQLRASILQKAIEGKLVPQLDSEPAVEQIGDAPEVVPFEIPEKWKWCCLGSVFDLKAGKLDRGASLVCNSRKMAQTTL